jgi:hypothetical protein
MLKVQVFSLQKIDVYYLISVKRVLLDTNQLCQFSEMLHT